MDEQIKLLLRRNKIIYAVNLVRQQKGWGLREAKEYVEEVERKIKRKRGLRKLPQPSMEIESEARRLLYSGQKEEAVEFLRKKTVMKRKDAQAYIESLSLIDSIQGQRRQDSSPSGGGMAQHSAPAAQEYQDDEALKEKARQLLLQQGKVAAIKFVRQHRRMGLRQAKDLVDGLASGGSSARGSQTAINQAISSDELEAKARQLLAKGRKFDAIKLARYTGRMGLREAKEYVEAL